MEKDTQATSIEQIKLMMENEKIKEFEIQQQQQQQQQQMQPIQQIQEQPKEIQQEIYKPLIQEKEQPDTIKLGFIGLIIFFVLSTSQIEEILYTFIGEEQKLMMPFIKIGIAGVATYFLKNYIE